MGLKGKNGEVFRSLILTILDTVVESGWLQCCNNNVTIKFWYFTREKLSRVSISFSLISLRPHPSVLVQLCIEITASKSEKAGKAFDGLWHSSHLYFRSLYLCSLANLWYWEIIADVGYFSKCFQVNVTILEASLFSPDDERLGVKDPFKFILVVKYLGIFTGIFLFFNLLMFN